jgi:16S rRNA G1207 methylase RsmC
VISTVAKLMPMGLAVNGLQAARGKEGTLSGSINYSVEVYDSASNNLLLAYVSKQYPSALDVGASLGPLGASKVGIDKGADALLSKLQPKLPIAAR